MTEQNVIWWIRRDLRLRDNQALAAAITAGPVIPVFVLDPRLLATSNRRTGFLVAGLKSLDADLRRIGSRLIVRQGDPLDALSGLVAETGARAIFAEEDYTPFSRTRDARVGAALPLTLVAGQTVQPPGMLAGANGRPYLVYGAYRRAWLAHLPPNIAPLPAPLQLEFPAAELFSEPLPDLADHPDFPAGETEALRRLDVFCEGLILDYKQARDRMGASGTSTLSPYLRFGMLSLREAVASACLLNKHASQGDRSYGPSVWLGELIWREFYIQVLAAFPYSARSSFNPRLVRIQWRNDPVEFEAWKNGMTGVPVVDAGMRQLKATGWMHNRARMITASYLVKDLLIDWRWGEAWFMKNLLDGDVAANNGGWQWVAGTGTDAAPYFRVFNPVLQGQKFDPLGVYVRRWVPELRDVPDPLIHTPWLAGEPLPGYPQKPLVDHAWARERVIQAYRVAKLLPE